MGVLAVWNRFVGVPCETFTKGWWYRQCGGAPRQRTVAEMVAHRVDYGAGGNCFDLALWLRQAFAAAGIPARLIGHDLGTAEAHIAVLADELRQGKQKPVGRLVQYGEQGPILGRVRNGRGAGSHLGAGACVWQECHCPTPKSGRTLPGRAPILTIRRLSTLFLIVTVLIWGSTLVATQWAMRGVGPFTTAALRFLIGWVILLAPAWRHGFRLRHVIKPDMLKYGLTGTALFYIFQNVGLLFTTPGNAALICAALPAVAALLSYFQLGERLPKPRLAGIGLSVLGVLLVSGTLPAAGGLRMMAGNALMLGGVISWGVYTIQGKRLPPDLPPLVITAASMGAGLLFLVPLAAVEVAVQGPPAFTLPGTLALLYLGVVASALTTFLWNYAIRHVDASVAAMYPNLIPVVGLMMAAASGEQIDTVQLAGCALAMAGVWLAERKVAPAGGRPAA